MAFVFSYLKVVNLFLQSYTHSVFRPVGSSYLS